MQDSSLKRPLSTSTSLLPQASSAPLVRLLPSTPSLGPCFPPFIVIDVYHGREQRVRSSYENTHEATLVVALLSRLVALGLRRQQQYRRNDSGKSSIGVGGGKVRVGVIAPYREQVQRIQKEIGDRRRLQGSAEDGGVTVEVRISPPSFQEERNILFSRLMESVRPTNPTGEIRFVASFRPLRLLRRLLSSLSDFFWVGM